jgi:threonine dehydrogenase-like Zn-dependent dehydrogenase
MFHEGIVMTETGGRAKAAVYLGPGQVGIQDFPLPKLGAGDMLVEVTISGVDGTELHIVRGDLEEYNANVPVILGDEIIGTVVAMGSDAGVNRGLKLGDRVTVEARWPCEGCHACDSGQYYACERAGNSGGYGGLSAAEPPHLWGGYATHIFIPEYALVHAVPEGLSDEVALVASSVLANGVRWTQRGGVREGSHVVILGPGPQGIAMSVAALDMGANVTLVGLAQDAERLKMAKAMGVVDTVEFQADDLETISAIHEKYGPADIVIDSAGAAVARSFALKAVRPLGTVVVTALPRPHVQQVDWWEIAMKELTIVSPLSHPNAVLPALHLAERLLAQGIDIGTWVSHVFSLEDTELAIATAGYQTDVRPIKVAIKP